MEYLEESRLCKSCNKLMKGRSDKKFCNDYCRNNYNNHLRAADNNLIRKINHSLMKNRRILANYLTDQTAVRKLSREVLSAQGFLFGYHTHQQQSRKGNLYRYCYEYGYLEKENGIVIVKQKKASIAEG